MGFVFEMLAPFLGGILAQLYQDGKINFKKLMYLMLIMLTLSFMGTVVFSDATFTLEIFLWVIGGSMLATFICGVSVIIWQVICKKKPHRAGANE